MAALDVDDIGGVTEGAVVGDGEHAGVDVDRAGEVVGGVGQQHRAVAVLLDPEAERGVGDLAGEDQAERLEDGRGVDDVEVGVRAEVGRAGDLEAVDAVVVDVDLGQVGEVERRDPGQLVLRGGVERRAGVGAVGDRADVDRAAAGDGDRGAEVDGGRETGAEARGAVGPAEGAVEEQVERAAVEVDQAGRRTRRRRLADELEGGTGVDGGVGVGVGAIEDEAAGERLHQDVAREGVGAGEAQGAEAGLGDAAEAAERAGHDRVDDGRAVLDLERTDRDGGAAEGDRVGEGERARGRRGGEDQRRGVGEEAVGPPGERGGRAAEVDGPVGADGGEAARAGELDLAGIGADGAREVARGELDRAAREVQVIEAAGRAGATRQGGGGGEADDAAFDAGLAGVEVDAGEGQHAGAGLGQAAGARERAGQGGVDDGAAVDHVDRALGGAEVDRVGEGDVVGGGDVGEEERGTGRDEAARAPVEHDAGGTEVHDAVGVEGVEARGAAELRLVGGGAKGAGEVTEAEAELARGERHVARAADPVGTAGQRQLGGEHQVAAVEERRAGEDIGAGEGQRLGAVLHEAAGAREVDVDGTRSGRDLGGRERAAREATAIDEEVVGRGLAGEVKHAARDGHGAGTQGRRIPEQEGAEGDGGAAGVGIGRTKGPGTAPALRDGDRIAAGIADERVEDRAAGGATLQDEGAGTGAGVGDGARAGEGQRVGRDSAADVDHAAGGAEGEEAVGGRGNAVEIEGATVEDEVGRAAGTGAHGAGEAAVTHRRHVQDTALDDGASGVGVTDVAEHQVTQTRLDQVVRAGDHAAEGQGDGRDDHVDGVRAVGAQRDEAVEGEVIEATEAEVAADLDGVGDRVGGGAGEQQGGVLEDELADTDRAGRRDDADRGASGARVEEEARAGADGEVAGEVALAAEGEHAAAGDGDRHRGQHRRAGVGQQGGDVEGRLPRREVLPAGGERDRGDGDRRGGGTAEFEGAARAAGDVGDGRGVLAVGDQRFGQRQGARADVDGGADRGVGGAVAAVIVDCQAGQAVVAVEGEGRLGVKDDPVGRVDLAERRTQLTHISATGREVGEVEGDRRVRRDV